MIMALAGRKQSGKGTIFSFVEALNGRAARATKEFSFAYLLKRLAVDVLGLEERQVFGTDQDKNTPVDHIRWENFPRQECRLIKNKHGLVVRTRRGPMTGREVLQFYGSEIFRHQYGDVWADATIRMVNAWLVDHPGGVAVITDCRFENEVDATLGAGGAVGRLTRIAFPEDNHMSETALDRDVFDWGRFSFVLDNADLDVYQTCLRAYPALRGLGVVPEVPFEALSMTAGRIAAPASDTITMGVAA